MDGAYDFICTEPVIKPLPDSRGGGYELVVEIPESEWEKIKEINAPYNKAVIFKGILKRVETAEDLLSED